MMVQQEKNRCSRLCNLGFKSKNPQLPCIDIFYPECGKNDNFMDHPPTSYLNPWIENNNAGVVICVGRLLHLCFRPSVLAIRPIKSIQFTPFCCCLLLLLSAIVRPVGQGAGGAVPPS